MLGIFFAAYYGILFLLAIYGIHRYILIFLWYRYRKKVVIAKKDLSIPPRITLQLPIYNEPCVATRIISACCNLQYPKELLDIQVLDDSDDYTPGLISELVKRKQKEGFNIKHIQRERRIGFKAGALENGLKMAEGEFIAIFDADFLPHPLFLLKTLPFFSDDNVGMVQTSWTHFNRNVTLLTVMQAMFIESHFAIEQTARFRSGRFFNFNGTSGIWRKKCIIESGGWYPDTLAEDLYLSYQAQLKGWKFVFIKDSLSDAELTIQMNAFKKQQQRWVMGAIQVARKLLPEITRSRQPLSVKIEAFLHLTNYLAYPLSLTVCLLIWPALLIRINTPWQGSIFIDLSLFVILTLSVFSYHLCAQAAWGSRNIFKTLCFIPLLMSVSIGISLSNSVAFLEALTKRNFVFHRTYKSGTLKDKDYYVCRVRRELLWRSSLPYIEVLLGIYFIFQFIYSMKNQFYQSLVFVCLFVVGFLYIGICSVFDFEENRTLHLSPLRKTT